MVLAATSMPASPDASIEAVVLPPGKVHEAPLCGGVKVTTPPCTGSPKALATEPTSGAAKALLTMVD
jgi:hypothetical protein